MYALFQREAESNRIAIAGSHLQGNINVLTVRWGTTQCCRGDNASPPFQPAGCICR